jgi:ribonucleotide monophosphatase NagD (HAD superfamily)
MIGDNPKTDIAGANARGWTTILVKTGVFDRKQKNDEEHPATHVVEDFEAAVDLIFALEK